jgi:hypothetical protein
MSELEKLIESVADKSVNTQKSYKTQYNKLHKLLGKDVNETSEKKLIEVVLEQPNNNQKQALINIGILIRRLYKLSTTKLEALREKLKENLKTDVKEKNAVLKDTLPSYSELVEYTDYLWEKMEWKDYIINYLLINYQVRNQDLVFDIVNKKRDTKDTDKNYMWITPKKVVYTRNVYKTASTYGKKTDTITDPKFILAVKRVYACSKRDEECGVFIPTLSQVGYYIKKATYKQLGEGAYVKIIINHFRKDLTKLKSISENRGSSLTTLAENYDIENL